MRALPHLDADILARVRAKSPRVHCITNAVAQAFTANVLLAVGAIPSMTIAAEEVAAFTGRADALLVNLGTFDADRRMAAEAAVDMAQSKPLPWVLDPVFIDRSPARTTFAQSLLDETPTAIRLNRAEFLALAGFDPEGGALSGFAQEHSTVIGLTGPIDHVTDGTRLVTIENGHPLMGCVTAMGCAASALVAACLAVEPDAFAATASALAAFGVAGEIAGARAGGPGSFAVEMIDALHGLDAVALTQRARIA